MRRASLQIPVLVSLRTGRKTCWAREDDSKSACIKACIPVMLEDVGGLYQYSPIGVRAGKAASLTRLVVLDEERRAACFDRWYARASTAL